MEKLWRLILLIFLSLVAFNAWGQSRRALLIGIGNYPEGSEWNLIHGNNDISIIRDALIRQGFSPENILQLIDSEATKKNILLSFDKLSECCQDGDVVYLHFSGHGQQITDLNGDEEDGFDEAWIPYDAKKKFVLGEYEGENHIIDDELNILFTKLRVRVGTRGKIVIVADACHSGSGSRGLHNDEVFARGTGDKFIIPHKSSNVIKKTAPTEWLFVAACKSYQSNYEYRTPVGDYYGVLSYVIAGDSKQFDVCKYIDLLQEWTDSVSGLSRYPQDLDNEGQPSRKNSYMF